MTESRETKPVDGVKRYQCHSDGLWHQGDKVTEVHTEGEWVKASDYDSARSTIASQAERIGEWRQQAIDRTADWRKCEIERDALKERIGELEARIDALMLDHCPDEMTREQRENWAKHQRAATKAERDAIDAAMSQEGK